MATEVGSGYVTIYPKTSPDFDKAISGKLKASGTKSGGSFGGAFSVAAGNLLSSGLEKALGAITAHMDSAIGRVDALNQFPKVMSNIGFSSEEASAAIQKMSDGIQGLPTTLDDIVGNTQQLALSMGDLGKASDVAIALNDGFLMFGASSSDVTNAITQLNQMITAGKYDMQSWNSINQAAPGFLDTVARSMLGAEGTAGQLREALNSGKVSTDDFLGAIVNLDQNGGEGITSFSDGVKSATGGIETSLSRVDSAITRNIANVLDLVATNVGFTDVCNTLVSIINTVGSVVMGVLTSAFIAAQPFVEQLMQAVTDLANACSPWLTDVINTLGTIITGVLIIVVTAAISIFTALINVVTGVINFFQTLWTAIQVAMTNANAAIMNFVGKAVGKFEEFKSGVQNAIDQAIGFIEGLADLPGRAAQWGSDLMQSFINGITGWFGDLQAKCSDVAGMIASYIHFSEPDVGPLSNFHTFMPDMMKQLAQGIRDNMGVVRREIDGVSGLLADGMTLDAAVNSAGATSNADVVAAVTMLHNDLESIIRSATPDGITGRQFGRLVRNYA